MCSIWERRAESIHEQLANNHGKHEFKIEAQDKELLSDHLTFLLTADTELIPSENDKKVIEDIIDIIKKKEGVDDACDTYVLLICTCIDIDGSGCALMPLIGYRKNTYISFIDHTAKSYETWDSFQKDNAWKGFSICLPKDGKYKKGESLCYLKSVAKENVQSYDCFKKELDKLSFDPDNLKHSAFIENNFLKFFEWFCKIFTDSEIKQYKETLRFSFYLNSLKTETSKYIECVSREFNFGKRDILNLLLEGFKEITGKRREYLGNAYFIRNIFSILIVSKNLDYLQLYNNNQLQITTNNLTLHAKALVQLSDEKLFSIFVEVPTHEEDVEYYGELKNLRFKLNSQRQNELKRICKALGVSNIHEFKLNGQIIFKEIEPIQIDSLFSVMLRACHKFNAMYIEIGICFASKIKCENIYDLCAAFEYITKTLDKNESRKLRKLKKEKDELRRKDIEKEIVENFKPHLEKHTKTFEEKIEKWKNLTQTGELNFVRPITAAYHYIKHNKVKKTNTVLSEEEYIALARRLVSKRDIAFTWTQDGSSKCFNITDDEHCAKAVMYEKVDGSSAVIATLFFSEPK